MVCSGHVVVGLLSFLDTRRLAARLVVREEKRQPLEYKVLPILSLSFESVVNVCKADIQVNHCVLGVQRVGSEEVIYRAMLAQYFAIMSARDDTYLEHTHSWCLHIVCGHTASGVQHPCHH